MNETWNKLPDSKFAFFDEEFIEKSVFSPSGIDTSHKRELYNYVVLGEENVAKATEMQLLVETEIPSKTKEISSLETQLKNAANINDIKTLIDLAPLTPEDFQILKAEVESKDIQIKNSESIKRHQLLNKLPIINWPDFSSILNKGLEEIGDVEKYETHILNHQKWIKEGVNIQAESTNCPYCLQDISKNEVIKAYKQFFSDECQLLINQLNKLSGEVASNFAVDKLHIVEKILDGNKDSCNFWQAMDNDISANIAFIEQYTPKLKNYSDTLLRLIELKLKNILEPLKISSLDQERLNIDVEINKAINIYNQDADLLNEKIAAGVAPIKPDHLASQSPFDKLSWCHHI